MYPDNNIQHKTNRSSRSENFPANSIIPNTSNTFLACVLLGFDSNHVYIKFSTPIQTGVSFVLIYTQLWLDDRYMCRADHVHYSNQLINNLSIESRTTNIHYKSPHELVTHNSNLILTIMFEWSD